jgi:hypothetical protein
MPIHDWTRVGAGIFHHGCGHANGVGLRRIWALV